MASSDRFDLSGDWGQVFSGAALHHGTAMQSMAVDPVTGDIYIAQLQSGVEGPTGSRALGNFCINRVDPWTGVRSEWMHLNGFGHGYQIGAQHINGRTHVWTEAGPIVDEYGTHVTRVPFSPKRTIEMTTTEKEFSTPFRPTLAEYPGALAYSCAPTVDPIHHRVTIRFKLKRPVAGGGTEDLGWFYGQYPIDPVSGNAGSNLIRWAQVPPKEDPRVAHMYGVGYQGFASNGDHLYIYTGDMRPEDNVHITVGTWPPENKGRLVDIVKQHITAVPTLERREPEGLAVAKVGTEAQLLFGFSGNNENPRAATLCSYSTATSQGGVRVYADWANLALNGVTAQGGVPPQGRLVEVADGLLLQLRGSFTCGLTSDTLVAKLPPQLVPRATVRASVPRNMYYGHGVCQAVVTPAGELQIHGPTETNKVTWVDLDSFSAAWR
ncbi:hypothetical protein J7F03_19345 [Streptomyces sp. ISL-43]|uniref:phage baseplate protein n=1 Tax=Streptomyces sp. ISL-43 TaxID=2819183 RepID=UPI001BECF5CC|nr:hypothetical protein [Streptomyces sp. ISL-43]MBT2449210.1 hypothetical protein [Streptomyces sp. ISL-43]